jgi:N-acyl-D-aspartate/D-glutamate deacylase
MMFMRFVEGWHRVIQADRERKAELLRDPQWRETARWEWDNVVQGFIPTNDLSRIRIVEVVDAADERWLGRSLGDLVDERGGHPSDVLADFVLANDCRPGVVSVGVANGDPAQVAELFGLDGVVIGSSDAGAHVQMLCASGDTTLLLTRHVRDRGDLELERAVWELTGRPAEIFGFADRGVVAEGRAGDLAVFDLDELHWDDDVLVDDLPGGAARLRRPEGGYRCTVVDGVVVQEAGELTGALPGRMLHGESERGRRGAARRRAPLRLEPER